MNDQKPRDLNLDRFFDGNKAALNCISSVLMGATDVRIATAYFEGSGYQALQSVLIGKKIQLLEFIWLC